MMISKFKIQQFYKNFEFKLSSNFVQLQIERFDSQNF